MKLEVQVQPLDNVPWVRGRAEEDGSLILGPGTQASGHSAAAAALPDTYRARCARQKGPSE